MMRVALSLFVLCACAYGQIWTTDGNSFLPLPSAPDYALFKPKLQTLLPQYDQCQYIGDATSGGGIYLLWSVGAGNADFAVMAKALGYLAFGLSGPNNTFMFISDVVIGRLVAGASDVHDYWIPAGPVRQASLDTSLGGRDDVTGTFSRSNGIGQLIWSRLTNTTDTQFDFTIAPGTVELIWALHNADDVAQHFSGRNYFYMDFYKTATCPRVSGNICNGNGQCVKGCCVCNSTFAGIDCSLPVTSSTTGSTTGLVAGGLTPNIVDGDYPFFAKLSSDFTVFWKLDQVNKEIELAVRAKVDGWVAFGMTSSKSMVESDVMVGWVDNGVVTVEDRYITARLAGCPGVCKDTAITGTNDILEFAGNEAGGVTELKWRRKFVTGDSKDLDFTDTGAKDVVFASRSGADGPALVQHDVGARAVASIDFFSGAVTVKNENVAGKRQAHGFLMFFAWSVFVPIASVIARYLKRFKWWFNVHRLINAFAMFIMLIGFIIAVDFSTTHFETFHKALGLAIVILGLAQPIIGTFADKWFDPDRSGTPFFPDISHWIIGWLTITAGLVNTVAGLYAYYNSTFKALVIVYLIYAIVVFLALLLLFVIMLIKNKGNSSH